VTLKLRPMLAGKAPEDLERLRFPLLASPKLDGIRCLIVDGVAVSRTLKPIRNRRVQELFGHEHFNGLDGELIVGSPTDPNCMQKTSSGVMTFAGEPDVRYFVFDRWDKPQVPFVERNRSLAGREDFSLEVVSHLHMSLWSAASVESFERDVLADGFEGLILRDPDAPYKYNRATTREQWMLKLKRYSDGEAVVIGVTEQEHNANDLESDERGYAKRSSAKEGKIPTGRLGALVCRLLVNKKPTDVTFNIGTGFDDWTRRTLWTTPPIGKIVTFKHFAQQGVLNAPRHPVFKSFRDPDDL